MQEAQGAEVFTCTCTYMYIVSLLLYMYYISTVKMLCTCTLYIHVHFVYTVGHQYTHLLPSNFSTINSFVYFDILSVGIVSRRFECRQQ